MVVARTGVAGTLNSILSDDAQRQDHAATIIANQPQAYTVEDVTLLALVLLSLVHEAPTAPTAESLFGTAYELDINIPVLPIEIPTYAATLDRENGPAYIDQYSDIVDEANDDRPDRPPLESATIIGPEVFLREVRAAFESGHTTFTQGSPVENDAIALAATLGQLPRTDNLRGD
ncbi:hypothetical protein ACQCX2_09560 [Propionibacteriaceae bacterium Y1700]|uniref:hypothetical protein n=1 Tax=Microlunatus sp. Y1700 TaxID=3418487 RepID=UPI003DA75528